MRKWALAVIVLAAGATGYPGATSPAATVPGALPTTTTISLRLAPGSLLTETRVVRSHRSAWFAALTASEATRATLRIYRWSGRQWALSGAVRVDELPVSPGDGGAVAAAFLTRSGAPDFTVRTWGADTQWFAVVSRIQGRWKTVPFDYGDGRTVAIDASGVRRGLVKAQVDSCFMGCAGGPETYSWYRFDRRNFVPTTPPGPAPDCSASALDRAAAIHYTGENLRSVEHAVRRPFRVARYACADGWALAETAARKAELALYEQRGDRWLKVMVGRNPVMDFAIPHSVVRRLRGALGLPLGRRPKDRSTYAPWTRFSTKGVAAPWLAKVAVRVPPGAFYADTVARRKTGARWLATAVESQSRLLTLRIYRWRGAAWLSQGQVRVNVRGRHATEPLSEIVSASLTNETTPDFEVGALTLPTWAAVVSHAGGTWHVVPFRNGRRISLLAYDGEGSRHLTVQEAHATVRYGYRNGVLAPVERPRREPPCSPRGLAPSRRSVFRHLACGYGYAVGTGITHGGKRTFAVFDPRHGIWSFDISGAKISDVLRWYDAPSWLASLLERQLLRH